MLSYLTSKVQKIINAVHSSLLDYDLSRRLAAKINLRCL